MMIAALTRSVLLCSALLAAVSAWGQPVADTEQADIVVEGKRTSKEEIRDFVRALTPIASRVQLARFERAACPKVLGLPPAQNALVEQRLRRVAEAVDIGSAGPGCTANILLLITRDKRPLIAELRRRGDFFGSMAFWRIAALAREPGPAVAWHLAGPPVSARGTELHFDEALQSYVNNTTEPASRLTQAARPQFEAAVVVVERRALDGLTTTQLADYTMMRAAARTDPARVAGTGEPTILRLLDIPVGGSMPITLTQWDLGFLRGMYSVPRNVSTGAQRSAITDSMARDLGGRTEK